MGFWTGLKANVIDWKHVRKMGKAIWLFGYLTTRQTALNKAGEGVVNYGHPLTLDVIRSDTKGIPIRTLKRWIARLKRNGYIRTEAHSKLGITFWISKGKHKTKLRKVVSKPEVAPNQDRSGADVSPNPSHFVTEVTPSVAQVLQQVIGFQCTTAKTKNPITKGFTPTNLSNHNKAAAAQSAASPAALVGNIKSKDDLNPKPRASNSDFVKWQEKKAATDPPVIEWKRQHGL
jgi:hypothetical protein